MKIHIFGDSLVYGKWDSQGGWVQRLRTYIDTKYNIGEESQNFQVFNLGIPGELAVRMIDRMGTELSHRVTDKDNLVILSIGINDSCTNNIFRGSQTPEEEFKKAIRELVATARKYSSNVVGIGLTPANPERSKGMLFSNEDVQKFDSYLSEIYKELNVPKLQLFDDLMAAGYPELLYDSAHPNDKGHAIIFEKVLEFLKQQGFVE